MMCMCAVEPVNPCIFVVTDVLFFVPVVFHAVVATAAVLLLLCFVVRDVADPQERATDAMFIIVSDVHLDKPQVCILVRFNQNGKIRCALISEPPILWFARRVIYSMTAGMSEKLMEKQRKGWS